MEGKCLDGDPVAATLFVDEFKEFTEKHQLTREQIYNVIESGLFWKRLPCETLAAKFEEHAPGHKMNTE